VHNAGLGVLDMETQDEQDCVWIRDDVQVRTGLPMKLACVHSGMGLERSHALIEDANAASFLHNRGKIQ
jgi:hypothetical protein